MARDDVSSDENGGEEAPLPLNLQQLDAALPISKSYNAVTPYLLVVGQLFISVCSVIKIRSRSSKDSKPAIGDNSLTDITAWLLLLTRFVLIRDSIFEPNFQQLQNKLRRELENSKVPIRQNEKVYKHFNDGLSRIQTIFEVEELFEKLEALYSKKSPDSKEPPFRPDSLLGCACRSICLCFKFMTVFEIDDLLQKFQVYLQHQSQYFSVLPAHLLLRDMPDIIRKKGKKYKEFLDISSLLAEGAHNLSLPSPFRNLLQANFYIQFKEAINYRNLPAVYSANLQFYETVRWKLHSKKIHPRVIFELARVCHRFGHRKMAAQAINESIRAAQSEKDTALLHESTLLLVDIYETQSSNVYITSVLEKCMKNAGDETSAVSRAAGFMQLAKIRLMHPPDNGLEHHKIWKALAESMNQPLEFDSITEVYSKLFLLQSMIWQKLGVPVMEDQYVRSFLKLYSKRASPSDRALGVCASCKNLSFIRSFEVLNHRLVHRNIQIETLENTFKESALLTKIHKALDEGQIWTAHRLWRLPELLISPQENLELYDELLFCDARLLFLSERYLEAFTITHEVLRICQATGRETFMPKHLLRLAQIQVKLHNKIEAIPYILRSLVLAQKCQLGNVTNEANITLAEIFLELGMFQKALKTMEGRTHQILSHGDVLMKIKAHIIMARCIIASEKAGEGSGHNLVEAEVELHSARILCENYEPKVCPATLKHLKFIFYTLARIYHARLDMENRTIASKKFLEVQFQLERIEASSVKHLHSHYR